MAQIRLEPVKKWPNLRPPKYIRKKVDFLIQVISGDFKHAFQGSSWKIDILLKKVFYETPPSTAVYL